jgi:hypothetical protein
MRFLVLIDGISTPRYLSKVNVVEEDVAAKDIEVDDSVPKYLSRRIMMHH